MVPCQVEGRSVTKGVEGVSSREVVPPGVVHPSKGSVLDSLKGKNVCVCCL